MLTRRDFLKSTGLSTALLVSGCTEAAKKSKPDNGRPNILWITCEDISPWLGCYGDDFAESPNIDALAAKGLRYTNAFATAPVCAPSRSCLITGVYATSLGTQHLRSDIKLPPQIRCFTEYLRNVGYYCTNNHKKDYNFEDVNAWDDSSPQAHWRKRKDNQPFFSVFNITNTHQSQINGTDEQWNEKYGDKLSADQRHDPAKVNLPPYYPDTPMTRKIFARYYDLITIMDQRVGELLAQLKEDNLEDDTVVFFYSDHGNGIPRHKRVLYDTGLNVPLIIQAPRKYRHLVNAKPGKTTDRLVSFVDFAPTVMSILNLPVPDYMQGHAFFGAQAERPREYIFGAASRVDEAYEMARCVRSHRYKYIRNYLPHLPLIQKSAYCDKAEIMCEFRRLLAEGKLDKNQKALFNPKAPAEFYDLQKDPLELNNLIDSPQHRDTIGNLAGILEYWMLETRDTGLMSEAEMLRRSQGTTPYELTRTKGFPMSKILKSAELAGTDNAEKVALRLQDDDPAVRYWAVIAAIQLDPASFPTAKLTPLLKDTNPNVRFAAAGLVAKRNDSSEVLDVLIKGIDESYGPIALYAAREIELLGEKASSVLKQIKSARDANALSDRHKDYKMFIDWSLTASIRSCGEQTDYIMKF